MHINLLRQTHTHTHTHIQSIVSCPAQLLLHERETRDGTRGCGGKRGKAGQVRREGRESVILPQEPKMLGDVVCQATSSTTDVWPLKMASASSVPLLPLFAWSVRQQVFVTSVRARTSRLHSSGFQTRHVDQRIGSFARHNDSLVVLRCVELRLDARSILTTTSLACVSLSIKASTQKDKAADPKP
jgi:hypothetical protein